MNFQWYYCNVDEKRWKWTHINVSIIHYCFRIKQKLQLLISKIRCCFTPPSSALAAKDDDGNCQVTYCRDHVHTEQFLFSKLFKTKSSILENLTEIKSSCDLYSYFSFFDRGKYEKFCINADKLLNICDAAVQLLGRWITTIIWLVRNIAIHFHPHKRFPTHDQHAWVLNLFGSEKQF